MREGTALEALELVARQPADLLAVPCHHDVRPGDRRQHVLQRLEARRRPLRVLPQELGDAGFVARDDRFERDPYLSGLERCSLLAVPIVGRGALRAVLMLENEFKRAQAALQALMKG